MIGFSKCEAGEDSSRFPSGTLCFFIFSSFFKFVFFFYQSFFVIKKESTSDDEWSDLILNCWTIGSQLTVKTHLSRHVDLSESVLQDPESVDLSECRLKWIKILSKFVKNTPKIPNFFAPSARFPMFSAEKCRLIWVST